MMLFYFVKLCTGFCCDEVLVRCQYDATPKNLYLMYQQHIPIHTLQRYDAVPRCAYSLPVLSLRMTL
jgi:hypothetical protein